MNRALICVALCALVHFPCSAESIFGIEMGKRIDLPECPFKTHEGSSVKYYDVLPKITCAQDAHPLNGYKINPREITFSQEEAPAIVRNWRMFVLEIDGRAEGFNFLTNGIQTQNEVLAVLTQKFGRPTSINRHTVSTVTSSPLDTFDAYWELPTVKITFWGTVNRVDRGEVLIDSPAASALRKSWTAEDQKKERQL